VLTDSALARADALLELLGLPSEEPRVQAALTDLARGMQPELDPDDDENYVDWITINEAGLEFGFEDGAYVLAMDPDLRRHGNLLLTQLYFYGETKKTRAYQGQLPFGLTFADDRTRVREKLVAYEATRRTYFRDAWNLPRFDVTAAYTPDSGLLESLFCHVRYRPWPPSPTNPSGAPPITLAQLVPLFGLRWSDHDFRSTLEVLDIDSRIGEIRFEHEADYRYDYGIELLFTESAKLPQPQPSSRGGLVFVGTTCYAERELDAREWKGQLPFDLSFNDTQHDLLAKVKRPPARHEDKDFSGQVDWQFERFELSVIYSNIENRVLRVSVNAPGYLSSR
jgi:hypothetical protein